ncbi:hypothetical protein ACH5RR_008288 [Cinchona calisaya]|uniref:Uncharacterized protein n=1 Tax=Cinchona calisaya TaxID=153742 RepID=A0ABD3AB34_9GENT
MEGESGGLDLEKKLQHQLIDAGVKLLMPWTWSSPPSEDKPCISAIQSKKPLVPCAGRGLCNFVSSNSLRDLGPAIVFGPSILPYH